MPLLTPEDYTNFPEIPPDATYIYGDDPNQFGELYLPQASDTPHPVIILVGTIARSLTDDGFAVWNIEYRRAGNGGDYPNMFLDVAQATDKLKWFYTRHNLDLDNVITVGHSAGGHIALWLAGRHKIPKSSELYMAQPLSIKGIIVLAGVVDASYAIEKGLCEGGLSVMMGGEPDAVPANYQVADPRSLLPIGVPQTHIIGEHDTEMMENAQQYIKEAKTAGDTIEVLTPSDAGHFEIVDVSSKTWQIVHDAIIAMGKL